MRPRPLLALAALVFALAAVTTGCGGGGDDSDGTSGPTVTIAGTKANDRGTGDVSGGEAEVVLADDSFEPTVLRGPAGEEATLTLRNDGARRHNFSIVRQNLDQDVEPGQTLTVGVSMPQSGQLLFFCKYHVGDGMAGALEADD